VSRQRKRGREFKFYPQVETRDARGNIVHRPDMDHPIKVRGTTTPQRSARAEVPGQVGIDVMSILVDVRTSPVYEDTYGETYPGRDPVEGISLWSLVKIDGREWDVVAPPGLHWGTRHTRHWSIDVRARPSGKGTGLPGG